MSRTSSWQAKIRPTTRCAILVRGGNRCAWCRKPLRKGSAQLDHVVPRCKGGSNRPDNLVPACGRCNLTRAWGRRSLADVLACYGILLADAWREVRRQLRAPLDRVAGRELADRWYPWAIEMRARDVDRVRRRAAALRELAKTMPGTEFPFGALAQGAAA